MESSPRERRHEKTRQAILDAARKIIATEGTEALSMRAIAQHIDYSPAGLYEYFDSKEEIVGAVCEQGHGRLTEYMQRADPDLPPDELLLQLGLAYIDFAVRNPDFFLLMFTNPNTGVAPESTSDQAVADMQKEGSSFPLLLRAIQRGVDEAILKPDLATACLRWHLRPGPWCMALRCCASATCATILAISTPWDSKHCGASAPA